MVILVLYFTGFTQTDFYVTYRWDIHNWQVGVFLNQNKLRTKEILPREKHW